MPLGAHRTALMGIAGVSGADVFLLSTQTATSDTLLSFTSDITSKHGEYIFRFYNINPETDGAYFQFQANASGESGYNEYMPTTYIHAEVSEGGADPSWSYNPPLDNAQATVFQSVNYNLGNGATESMAGELHIFNPSSTVYVKHFYGKSVVHIHGDRVYHSHFAGYFNTTAALTNVQFKMNSGDWDGLVKMWGVSN